MTSPGQVIFSNKSYGNCESILICFRSKVYEVWWKSYENSQRYGLRARSSMKESRTTQGALSGERGGCSIVCSSRFPK